MREYEVTIIIQPQLEENERNQLVERVGNLLSPDAAEADKPEVNVWGMRRLAYPINNFSEGYYILYDAKIDPARVRDIERSLQFNEDLLRYLVVRKGS